MKCRSEIFYGEGYRDAASVMSHEVFDLQNTDILRTLIDTTFSGSNIRRKLEILEYEIDTGERDEDDDGSFFNFIEVVSQNELVGIDFFKEVLDDLNSALNKNIKYCLWLCDTKDEVYAYDIDGQLDDTCIDWYNESDVVLSDCGPEGRLYGFEEMPKALVDMFHIIKE